MFPVTNTYIRFIKHVFLVGFQNTAIEPDLVSVLQVCLWPSALLVSILRDNL